MAACVPAQVEENLSLAIFKDEGEAKKVLKGVVWCGREQPLPTLRWQLSGGCWTIWDGRLRKWIACSMYVLRVISLLRKPLVFFKTAWDCAMIVS